MSVILYIYVAHLCGGYFHFNMLPALSIRRAAVANFRRLCHPHPHRFVC
jgi:hypothetical protein